MKKLQELKMFLFAALVIFSVSGTALAGSQDFTLINSLGQTIREINLGPTKCSEWIFQDELGRHVLREKYKE